MDKIKHFHQKNGERSEIKLTKISNPCRMCFLIPLASMPLDRMLTPCSAYNPLPNMCILLMATLHIVTLRTHGDFIVLPAPWPDILLS